MNRQYSWGLWALLLSGFLLACQSDDEPSIDLISGDWFWVKTDGVGVAGAYTNTPEQAGYTQSISFMGSTVKRFTNGQLVDEFSYAVSTKDQSKLLEFYNQDGSLAEHFLVEIKADALILSNVETCCDNTFASLFQRKLDPSGN